MIICDYLLVFFKWKDKSKLIKIVTFGRRKEKDRRDRDEG